MGRRGSLPGCVALLALAACSEPDQWHFRFSAGEQTGSGAGVQSGGFTLVVVQSLTAADWGGLAGWTLPGHDDAAILVFLDDQVVARTDADPHSGAFVLPEVAPAVYDVVSMLAGEEVARLDGVEVRPHTITESLLLGVAAISGRVSVGDEPVAGANVLATRDGETVASAETDDSGTYLVGPLPAGTYSLTFAAEGFEHSGFEIAVRPGEEASSDVSLSAAESARCFPYDGPARWASSSCESRSGPARPSWWRSSPSGSGRGRWPPRSRRVCKACEGPVSRPATRISFRSPCRWSETRLRS
ncbi:MAG: carboxypeptidase regulatory-like domain-containing protein [Planctomycetota bacterium]